jgi:hypothetical protein
MLKMNPPHKIAANGERVPEGLAQAFAPMHRTKQAEITSPAPHRAQREGFFGTGVGG